MNIILRDLRNLRERLADPENWHKGDFFADFPKADLIDLEEDGLPDCPACLYGAIAYVRGVPNTGSNVASALEYVLPDQYYGDLVNFNDHPDTTHADVLALIDKAISNEIA